MRKIVTLALPLLLLSLMTIQCKAVITPVEIERAKDVYSIRMKGDHHTKSFLFHYENLSPEVHNLTVCGTIDSPHNPTMHVTWVGAICEPEEALESSFEGDYGSTFNFSIEIHSIPDAYEYFIDGSVVIPPPP